MSQSDLLRATEKLIEVHRGWCNFCKGNVDWCRNAPPGGCTVPAVESALAHLAQPEAAGPDDILLEIGMDPSTPIFIPCATCMTAACASKRKCLAPVAAQPVMGSPLQKLGAYLTNVLDEDQWLTAEQYLNAALAAQPTEPMQEHQWTEPRGPIKWPHCSVCGTIQRTDGKNGPCKGRAPITLRAAQPDDLAEEFMELARQKHWNLSLSNKQEAVFQRIIASLRRVMDEAHDHKRVSPEGKKAGRWLAKFVYRHIVLLELEGEPDERCKTCAFRDGTVPNGCIQTQADAMKAMLEGTPFLCHQDLGKTCHGWYAGRVALKGQTKLVPWDFSPEDDA